MLVEFIESTWLINSCFLKDYAFDDLMLAYTYSSDSTLNSGEKLKKINTTYDDSYNGFL